MAVPGLACLTDYERRAQILLDKMAADYYATGADDQQTLQDNVQDLKSLYLRPKMMVDVSAVDLRTTVLGAPISFPVCVAPTGIHMLAHPLGELATARAVDSVDSCMCLSTGSNVSMDKIAEETPNLLRWFQLYICRDRGLSVQLVRRAERAGFKAIVVTIDRPEQGCRRSNTNNKFAMPPNMRFENLDGLKSELVGSDQENQYAVLHSMFDNTLTWQDLAWLTTITCLPIIAKGVLTGHDAREAISAGCSAIYVSNHGGRQLDGTYSGIAALGEVVKAVDGRVEVYVDGGFRTGTDVLKALALGARAVFVGRPVLYGLAVKGEEGVRNVLNILRKELKLGMQLCGVTDVHHVPADLIIHKSRIPRL